MKTIISTPKAPAAIGPYSQAVLVNGMLFTSGVIPIDPETNTLVQGDVEAMGYRQMVRHWTLTPAFSRFESL